MAIDRRELERLIPALRRYARGLAGASVADDLVQDCLMKAIARERQFRGENLAGWVYAILVNCVREAARASRRLPPVDPLADVADAGSDPASRIGIIAALGALGHEHREVLLLVVVEGFTYQEASEILTVPIGTVMSRLARARDQLAQRLDGAPVVPLRRVK
ncbi:MAG: RNA polymerase sigma factor [Bauldia sp.]|nr:RNA polymerase sigma factor [Bauldia sp.]